MKDNTITKLSDRINIVVEPELKLELNLCGKSTTKCKDVETVLSWCQEINAKSLKTVFKIENPGSDCELFILKALFAFDENPNLNSVTIYWEYLKNDRRSHLVSDNFSKVFSNYTHHISLN